jgi:hypothetical protein
MNTLYTLVHSEHISQLNRFLFTAGESQTPDPSLAEGGFEMQLSDGHYQQYDKQFQDNAAPEITGMAPDRFCYSIVLLRMKISTCSSVNVKMKSEIDNVGSEGEGFCTVFVS